MSDDEQIWYELGIIIGKKKKEYRDKIKAKIEEDKFYKRKAEQLQWRLDAYERLSDCNEEFEL